MGQLQSSRLGRLFASGFGIGYSPILPGTIASAVTVFLYLFFLQKPSWYLVGLLLFGGLGGWSAHQALRTTTEKDPTWIVMDEFLGMLITLFWIPPRIPYLVIGFALFRFFDSVKVPPLERLERLPGAWGIFLDDVGAGVYANLCLQLLRLLG